jgi:hypothetical protein
MATGAVEFGMVGKGEEALNVGMAGPTLFQRLRRFRVMRTVAGNTRLRRIVRFGYDLRETGRPGREILVAEQAERSRSRHRGLDIFRVFTMR